MKTLIFCLFFAIDLQSVRCEVIEDMEIDSDQLDLMGLVSYDNGESRQWPSRSWGTTIEYLIDSPLEVGRPNITTALKQIEAVVTCLKFKEIPNSTQNLHLKEKKIQKTNQN